MYADLAILTAIIFFYSITSGSLERTPINGALVFIACGLAFGPFGLGLLSLDLDIGGWHTFAELTLALILFIDAANANLDELKYSFRIPQRLLVIALPLIILLGFAVGISLFDELTLLEIVILATILAPTDAALGKAVVTNENVPTNIREGLNVESGLNDGICVPILLVFLALATASGGEGSTSIFALKLFAQQIGIGVAVGVVLTVLGTWLLKICADRGWVTETWKQLPVVALAVACFAVAQGLGGSGFIASFVGGMLFGWIAKQHKHGLLLAAEGTGDTLALIIWVIFGADIVGVAFAYFSWKVVLYALLSLTLIRMLPVFLVLAGRGLRTDEKLFIGWFGPRGLASIVFTAIVLHEHLPGGKTIAIIVVWTIIISIVAHGLSANPLAALLGARIKNSERKTMAGEQGEV